VNSQTKVKHFPLPGSETINDAIPVLKKLGSISNAAQPSKNLKRRVISPGISVQYSFLNSGSTGNKLLRERYSD
jgi:hypothetical protein